MATTLAFYSDAGLTAAMAQLTALQAVDGSAAPEDRVVYLGSPTPARKFKVAANPGVGVITVSINDAVSGSGVAASAVRLALSAAGLDSATPGAALSLGTQLLSGVANAVAIHVRIDAPPLAKGNYTDLSLVTPTLSEIDA